MAPIASAFKSAAGDRMSLVVLMVGQATLQPALDAQVRHSNENHVRGIGLSVQTRSSRQSAAKQTESVSAADKDAVSDETAATGSAWRWRPSIYRRVQTALDQTRT